MIEEIIQKKFKEIEQDKSSMPLNLLKRQIKGYSSGARFKAALKNKEILSLIAELKKASPSKGLLREDFDIEQIATDYKEAGASALSVLTEENYFLGDKSYIQSIKKISNLPILQKDFFIDEYQIYEAAVIGSDCILLIAAALEPKKLIKFQQIAKELDIACLVEVHNKADLDKALKSQPEIIGINNRNLKNFKVDISNTFNLMRDISSYPDIIKVSESGIKTHQDTIRLKQAGIDAILVGETFMKAKNIKDEVNKLMGNNS
jgi:indole-3-glycerol phosphate synthase